MADKEGPPPSSGQTKDISAASTSDPPDTAVTEAQSSGQSSVAVETAAEMQLDAPAVEQITWKQALEDPNILVVSEESYPMDEDDNIVWQASPVVEYQEGMVILRTFLQHKYNAVVKLHINWVFGSAGVFGTPWWRPHKKMPGDMPPPTGRVEDKYCKPAHCSSKIGPKYADWRGVHDALQKLGLGDHDLVTVFDKAEDMMEIHEVHRKWPKFDDPLVEDEIEYLEPFVHFLFMGQLEYLPDDFPVGIERLWRRYVADEAFARAHGADTPRQHGDPDPAVWDGSPPMDKDLHAIRIAWSMKAKMEESALALKQRLNKRALFRPERPVVPDQLRWVCDRAEKYQFEGAYAALFPELCGLPWGWWENYHGARNITTMTTDPKEMAIRNRVLHAVWIELQRQKLEEQDSLSESE